MNIKGLFFCLILLSLQSCNKPNPYTPNPDEYIVRQLAEKKIVMLGDFGHEYPLPFHTLSMVLSTWVTMLRNGGSDQNRLTLFLEEDSMMIGLIDRYIRTGDPDPWLDFILPSTSLERLEFYADLRRLILRIDSINATLPSSKQIAFDIRGPEAMNVFDQRILDSTDKPAVRFFVQARDSLSAANIISYLKNHPDRKGLIFYGSAHLQKRIVTKPFTESLPPEERQGAFLAWYLKKEFGENQVASVTQIMKGTTSINLNTFDKDVLIFAEDVPWNNTTDTATISPADYDAFIIRTEVRTIPHFLSHIFSKRIIAASLRRMEFLEPHLNRGGDDLVPHTTPVFAQRLYTQATQALQFLYDTNFATLTGWKAWCSAHNIIDLDKLKSDEFRKEFAERGYRNRKNVLYLEDLENLGFDQRTGNPTTMTRGEWDHLFEKMWPQVVTLNAIGISWVGEPDERTKAKDYLAGVTGQKFSEPSDYLKWWRKKYFETTY